MPALAILLLATQVVYKWAPTVNVDYDMAVKMDGFLPILGGNQGVAEVRLGLSVRGAESPDGNLKATSHLTSAVIKFNNEKLPLDLKAVEDYFPKASVTFSPLGEILANDAPDKKPPVRLPGLDVKRLPDISFLAVQFPASGVAPGDTWTFDKTFEGAPVHYTCTAKTVDDEKVEVGVAVKQEMKYDETETLEVAKDPADATGHVTMELTGTGTVDFDPKLGVVRSVAMDSEAVSTVQDIKTGGTKERRLKQTLRVSEKGTPASPVPAAPVAAPRSWWQGVQAWGTALALKSAAYWRMLEVWIQSALRSAPWTGR